MDGWKEGWMKCGEEMLNEVVGGKVLNQKVKKINLSSFCTFSWSPFPNVLHNLNLCPLSDQTCFQERT